MNDLNIEAVYESLNGKATSSNVRENVRDIQTGVKLRRKSTVLIMAAILSNGCATYAPFTDEEHCALRGMALKGVAESNGHETSFTTASVYSGGASGYGNAVTSSRSYNETRICEKPKPEETADVAVYWRSAQPKLQYNYTVKEKKWLEAAGYVLWIAPGVALKLVHDKQLDKAVADSMRIRTEGLSKPSSVDASKLSQDGE